MKKLLSLILPCTLSLLVVAPVVAQEGDPDIMTYHHCDFTQGIPADYATYDMDGQTLHYTMVQAGIKQGEAWTRKKELGKENYFAVSACRYKEEEGVELKPSDDWLILPLVWVRGESAALSWDAMSMKSRQDMGAAYEVLISTTGNTPADFTQPAVFTTPEEVMGEWTHHSVDLAAYAGQHIYIAFHNNSAQGDLLCVDNIDVQGLRGVCDFAVTSGTHLFASNELPVSLSITSYAAEPITDMTLYYRHNDDMVTYTLSDLSIAKYETFEYTFDETIHIAYSDTAYYTVGAVVNGVKQDEIDCSTVAFMFKPDHKIVVEEATGMWCSYCPAGIEAMEILEEKYPNHLVGLALHYNDEVGVDDYVLDLEFDGFPSAWVNRKHYVTTPMVPIENDGVTEYVTTHGGLETFFLKELEHIATAGVTIENVTVNDNLITVASCVSPAIDLADMNYRLALVIVENNVWKEDYGQVNGYSGKDIVIGGWESLPPVVTENFALQHVVRCIYDDYQGIEGSIPTTLLAGEEHRAEYTYTLPATILDMKNVKVVAMIIDLDNGSIINACEKYVSAGVEAVPAAQSHCYAADGAVCVSLASGAPARIMVHNLSGMLVASCDNVHDQARIGVDAQGVYIVTIEQAGEVQVCKVLVK